MLANFSTQMCITVWKSEAVYIQSGTATKFLAECTEVSAKLPFGIRLREGAEPNPGPC